jgi:RNA polymerase sigma-70 factor (ECF subfamily)
MVHVVAASDITSVFRAGAGRAVATLTRQFRSLDLAEESVQDAFVVALDRWPADGLPPSPVGWIITTARRIALDRLRREASRQSRHEQSMQLMEPDDRLEDALVVDDQLRLIFTCCHPSLDVSAQVGLSLRLIAGLQTSEIARAFLVPEVTMAQRIVRAKNKIRAANIPYRIPATDQLPARVHAVLGVIYLVFNEGYVASAGDALDRPDLVIEAIRLARTLNELMPNELEVRGLLALMVLIESRRVARTTADGSLVRLSDQDRTLWNRTLITEGQQLVRHCLAQNIPGPYQIQAAINAVHSDAASIADTDWSQIVQLYDQLLMHAPTQVVALNRAVAIAELRGPREALTILETLALDHYYLWHAARADMLDRLGHCAEAITAYDHAITLTSNAAEKHLLQQRRARLLA